jgi:hypothetical protein
MVTPEQYYTDPSLHGNYQFTTLKDVIESLLIEQLDPDSYIKNINRNVLIYHAKMGLRELTKSANTSILAIEMTVGDSGYIAMPQDYVDYVRISLVVIDGSGTRRLYPLDVNENINTAKAYLQDNNAEILFDNEGYPLEDNGGAYAGGFTSLGFITNYCGGNAFLDTSLLSRNGEFKVDEDSGNLIFGSELIDQEVVIEYESDGLQFELISETEIKIHKHIEEALRDYTYAACIAKRRSVPANEKQRALDRYKTTRHIAKLNRAGLDLMSIVRAMRSKTKYV